MRPGAVESVVDAVARHGEFGPQLLRALSVRAVEIGTELLRRDGADEASVAEVSAAARFIRLLTLLCRCLPNCVAIITSDADAQVCIDMRIDMCVDMGIDMCIDMRINMSIHMSINMSIHMSINMSIHMSVLMFVLRSMHMSIHMSVHMSIHMSMHMSVLMFVLRSMHMSIHMSIHWLVHLPMRMSIRMSMCLFIHMSETKLLYMSLRHVHGPSPLNKTIYMSIPVPLRMPIHAAVHVSIHRLFLLGCPVPEATVVDVLGSDGI